MRYQYTSPGGRNPYQTALKNTPPGIKLLVMINIIVFVLISLSGLKGELYRQFGLVPIYFWQDLKIWQPFTYLFLHGNFTHLLINMFVLWMFGRELEDVWGRKEFFTFYFITGIGSGLFTIVFNSYSFVPVVGASGAIYGLLLAYGVLYPNRQVYVYFLFPVKVKYFVAAIAGISFIASLSPEQSVISHLTHLSGMLVGWVYLKWGMHQGMMKHILLKYQLNKMKKDMTKPTPPKKKSPEIDDTLFQRRVDQVLDKMNEHGWEKLTEAEKNILYSASQKSSQNQPPN